MSWWANEAEMEDDIVAAIEADGGELHEDVIFERVQLRAVERALDAAAGAGDIDQRVIDGEKFFRARLSRDEKVKRAVELRSAGLRFSDIARELWIDPATVPMYLFDARRMDLWHVRPRLLAQWREEAGERTPEGTSKAKPRLREEGK